MIKEVKKSKLNSAGVYSCFKDGRRHSHEHVEAFLTSLLAQKASGQEKIIMFPLLSSSLSPFIFCWARSAC